jgi:hypothetical protein
MSQWPGELGGAEKRSVSVAHFAAVIKLASFPLTIELASATQSSTAAVQPLS